MNDEKVYSVRWTARGDSSPKFASAREGHYEHRAPKGAHRMTLADAACRALRQTREYGPAQKFEVVKITPPPQLNYIVEVVA